MSDSPSSTRTKEIGVLLGQNMARHRRIRGWTQQELAEKVGIDSVTISRLETGTSLPSLVRLAEIADVLKVSLGELLGGVSPHATDQATEIATCLEQLGEQDRRMLVGIMKQLAGRLARK